MFGKSILVLLLTASLSLAAEWKMPAKQVSVVTQDWSYLAPTSVPPVLTGSTVQATFDWMDREWDFGYMTLISNLLYDTPYLTWDLVTNENYVTEAQVDDAYTELRDWVVDQNYATNLLLRGLYPVLVTTPDTESLASFTAAGTRLRQGTAVGLPLIGLPAPQYGMVVTCNTSYVSYGMRETTLAPGLYVAHVDIVASADSSNMTLITPNSAVWSNAVGSPYSVLTPLVDAYYTHNNLALAPDGTHAMFAMPGNGDSLVESVDGGKTWQTNAAFLSTVTPPAAVPNAVALSSNGTYRIVTSRTSRDIAQSSDGGTTWVTKTVGSIASPEWTYVSMSGDGKYRLLAGLVYGYSRVYRSSDYGSNWTSVASVAGCMPTSLALSSNGQYQYIATRYMLAYTGYANTLRGLMRSADYGANWSTVEPLDIVSAMYPSISLVVCSQDGQNVLWFNDGSSTELNGFYFSSDAGVLWDRSPMVSVGGSVQSDVRDITMSEDGSIWGAALFSSVVYTPAPYAASVVVSSDGGNSWIPLPFSNDPTNQAVDGAQSVCLEMSSSGTNLLERSRYPVFRVRYTALAGSTEVAGSAMLTFAPTSTDRYIGLLRTDPYRSSVWGSPLPEGQVSFLGRATRLYAVTEAMTNSPPLTLQLLFSGSNSTFSVSSIRWTILRQDLPSEPVVDLYGGRFNVPDVRIIP